MIRTLTVRALLAFALAGCAHSVPSVPPQRALYRDLERLVSLRVAAGWQIDRLELEALMPPVLMSVCRVPPEHTRGLENWLDERIAALGGPVEEAFIARGRKLSRVSELLRLTRIRSALRAARTAADADCPFWLVPAEAFAGRQISDDRWQLSIGGGGKGMLVRQQGQTDLQFGGAGRVLLGRNLGMRWAVYTGLDVGGSAAVPKTPGGDRASLILSGDLVAPVVVRYRMVNSYFEFEGGYLAHASEDDWERISHGVHLGAGFGARAARVRWFFPGAAFGVAYDRVDDGGLPRHAIKMGLRVAFDIDF